jgi:pyruvate/2-oxoglutarate dehydrogenase complex dihydrolipoamide acyltransferase (E2) component
MASVTGRRLHYGGFPRHEIVQRLAGFVGDKFDDSGVIDGALGAQYLKELRHLLENPALLMV